MQEYRRRLLACFEFAPTRSLSPPLGEACEHREQGGEFFLTVCPHPKALRAFDLPEWEVKECLAQNLHYEFK
jgi:hypothetical protein